MIDSHAHIISEFYDNIDDIVNFLKNKGVLKVINCADSVETSYEVLDLSKKYDDFLMPTVGIHPGHVEDLDKLLNYLKVINFVRLGKLDLIIIMVKKIKKIKSKYLKLNLI